MVLRQIWPFWTTRSQSVVWIKEIHTIIHWNRDLQPQRRRIQPPGRCCRNWAVWKPVGSWRLFAGLFTSGWVDLEGSGCRVKPRRSTKQLSRSRRTHKQPAEESCPTFAVINRVPGVTSKMWASETGRTINPHRENHSDRIEQKNKIFRIKANPPSEPLGWPQKQRTRTPGSFC